jgi:hypothetical protein
MADLDANLADLPYWEAGANFCTCVDEAPTMLGDVTGPGVIEAVSDSELGQDIDVISDLRPSFVLCSGFRNLGNAIARRLSTPAGALAAIGDDPDYGYDIRGMLNAESTEDEISRIGQDIEAEIMKEDRVQSADVVSTFTWAAYDLAVEINILTKSGPFRLILGVGTATVDVINEGIVQASAG